MIWKPDTCECVIEFDGVNDEDHLVSVIQKCSEHQALTDGQTCHAVLAENKTRNRLVHHLVENITEISESFTGEDGVGRRRFRTGRAPQFSFDQNRKIVVSLNGGIGPVRKGVIATLIATLINNDEVLSDFGDQQDHEII